MPGLSNDSPGDMLDLQRYPVLDLASAGAQALVADSQSQFQTTGACHLPGLVRLAVAAALVGEVEAVLPHGFRTEVSHNVYFKPDDESLADDHPARHKERTSKSSVAYDQIPPESGIARLYTWEPLRQFIAAVLGQETLYLNADSMAALNLFAYETGDEIGWHYDRSDFVTTILLQAPEAGGVYEYAPNLRTEADEHFERLGRVLAGNDASVARLSGEPGSLTLFSGHYSLHRVTPVQGPRPRVIAVLSYEREPGVVFSEYARKLFYGRS